MKKQILINGQNNKYQLKKIVEEKSTEPKEKKKLVDSFFYNKEMNDNVLEYLSQIGKSSLTTETENEMCKNIQTKLNGYKNQDIKKTIHDDSLFVKSHQVVDLLMKQQMKCFYCNSMCLLFHKYVREKSQWTLDRIDNSKGHWIDNVILSCLECNLSRRNRNKDKFYQGKNMNIVKIHE